MQYALIQLLLLKTKQKYKASSCFDLQRHMHKGTGPGNNQGLNPAQILHTKPASQHLSFNPSTQKQSLFTIIFQEWVFSSKSCVQRKKKKMPFSNLSSSLLTSSCLTPLSIS